MPTANIGNQGRESCDCGENRELGPAPAALGEFECDGCGALFPLWSGTIISTSRSEALPAGEPILDETSVTHDLEHLTLEQLGELLERAADHAHDAQVAAYSSAREVLRSLPVRIVKSCAIVGLGWRRSSRARSSGSS